MATKQARQARQARQAARIYSVASGTVVATAANAKCAVCCLIYLPDGLYSIEGDTDFYEVIRARGELKVYGMGGTHHTLTAPTHNDPADSPIEWKFNLVD